MCRGRTGEGEIRGEPSLELIEDARNLTDAVIEVCGGTPAEADAVGIEVVVAIATYWQRLDLARLAADTEAWTVYLMREICLRWLAAIKRGRSSLPFAQSLARARLLALAENVELSALERKLLERVHVFGLTVAEAACTAGITVEEAAERLGQLKNRLRFEHTYPDSP